MLSRDELPNSIDLNSNQSTQVHLHPECLSDSVALFITRSLRFFADTFFKKRYGHRAVVLETIAAVPGMVGGMLAHFKSVGYTRHRKKWQDGPMAKKKKSPRPKAQTPKGFRDYFGVEVSARGDMLKTITSVYHRYGFDALESSAVETVEALGKFLPDLDRPNEGVFAWQEDDSDWVA